MKCENRDYLKRKIFSTLKQYSFGKFEKKKSDVESIVLKKLN